MDEARAMLQQDRLTMLVTEEMQSFSSQKQTLNALVFFQTHVSKGGGATGVRSPFDQMTVLV